MAETVIADLVDKIRGMVWGGLGDVLNVLDEDYLAGSDTLVLADRTLGMSNSSMVCAGLNTFYVRSAGSDGKTLKVLPAADGGPDDDLLAGTVVRLRPKATTWSIWRELHDAIVDLASPKSGVFQPTTFTLPPNYRNGMYPLPQEWFDSPYQPQKLVRVRYQQRGIADWFPVFTAQWMVERYAVHILEEPDDVAQYEFTFGWPFRSPTGLDDNLFDLGLTEKSTQNLPCLQAASRLALSVEGRRTQPFAQGDSRRPEEVPATASLSVSREFARQYDVALQAERSRLGALFSSQFRIGSST